MNEREGNYFGRAMLLTFIVGAAAGVTAVLLLAPNARRESAEKIKELSRDLKRRATTTLDTAKDKMTSTVARGRTYVGEKRAAVEAAVEAGREAYLAKSVHHD